MMYPPILAKTVDGITRLLDEQMTHGVVLLDHQFNEETRRYKDNIVTHPQSMSKFLRQAAKELKRPYIKAETFAWDRVVMHVPSRRYLAPVIAPLLLMGTEGSPSGSGEPVKFLRRPSLTTFYTTREIFYNWREGITHDPLCRKALRLEVMN